MNDLVWIAIWHIREVIWRLCLQPITK